MVLNLLAKFLKGFLFLGILGYNTKLNFFWENELHYVCPEIQNFSSLFKIICSNIFIRNGKIFWKHGPYCWYLHLNLYLGWPYRESIKTATNGGFCEVLLSENDLESVLATFCRYNYGANASEAVQKITTDKKECHKCSSCVVICWIAKIYLSTSINNSEKRLVTRAPRT